ALDRGLAELVLHGHGERAAGAALGGGRRALLGPAGGEGHSGQQDADQAHRILLRIGTHIGGPVTGSSTTQASRPSTSWTKAASRMSGGDRAGCTRPSRRATRWSA